MLRFKSPDYNYSVTIKRSLRKLFNLLFTSLQIKFFFAFSSP